jgi:RNA polymerase sigma-70 factor (ECF subfamily)
LPDDAGDLRRAAAGDEAAAAGIYDRHAPAVLRFLTVMLGEEQAAEDVLQESFVYLFRNAERYDPTQSALGTWLRRIAFSLAKNELRRRRRKPAVSLNTPVSAEGKVRPLAELLPDRPPPGDERGGALQLISRLDEEDREILILRHVEGLPPREIAVILGISPKATSMRLWRAAKELQKMIRREEPDLQ